MEISVKGSSTSGLISHLQSTHKKEYAEIQGMGTASFAASKKQPSVSSIFDPKPKQKDQKQLREDYENAAANFVMTESQPLNVVEKPAFRRMFSVFHRDAEKVTMLSTKTVKKNIEHVGTLAERAVKMELGKYKVSWTTDHWTGKDSKTYQTITCHYIDDDWKLRRCMIDFKVSRYSVEALRVNAFTRTAKKYLRSTT